MFNRIALATFAAAALLSTQTFAAPPAPAPHHAVAPRPGDVQPIEAALAKAKSLMPQGRVVSLELDREHGFMVWEAKIASPNGARMKVELDAYTLEPMQYGHRHHW